MPRPARSLESYNRAFYERCWRAGTVVPMPGIPAPGGSPAVEIGAGLRPRLPLERGLFIDVSRAACVKLRRAGAAAVSASVAHGFTLDAFAPFGMRPRSRVLTWLGAYFLARWPRLALRHEERFLRRRADGVLIVQRTDPRTFVREATGLDGVVTVWRRVTPPS